MQAELFDPSPRYTVTSLTRRLRVLIENQTELQDIWVEGEISNHSRPASGHVYFTLKDGGAQLKCVMWRSDAARLKLALQDGMAVEARGSIGVYEVGGSYQLYARLLRPLGEGSLYAEFLRLKALLEAEGLFDPERKREIPEQARKIGVVTSPSGAAWQDILDTIARRYPLAEVILAPTLVQGAEAPRAIIQALRNLNAWEAPDVIILARGGGSMEDLWAFNDEGVVRVVADSKAPVISGVGHETDFTLVDFAADLRAPTPTAAAELATQITIEDLKAGTRQMGQFLNSEMQALTQHLRDELVFLQGRLRILSPKRRIQNESQRLDDIQRRLQGIQTHNILLARTRLAGMDKRLISLNPLAILQRGYAVVTRKADGVTVREKASAQPGEALRVRVSDGEFEARVTGE